MPHTIALILAGGTGSRFGSARPKQFTLVAGRTVLEHSIAAFEQNEEIDEIGEVLISDIENIPTIRRTDGDLRRIRQNSNSAEPVVAPTPEEEAPQTEPNE